MTPVALRDIVNAMAIQSDEAPHYLDRETGEVVFVGRDDLEAAEGDGALEEYDDWQRGVIELARQILADTSDRFVNLPSSYEINEYAIMEAFCYSVEQQAISDRLLDAIRGRVAFRRFKERIHECGIANDWHHFRDTALEEIAKEWCEENQIAYQ